MSLPGGDGGLGVETAQGAIAVLFTLLARLFAGLGLIYAGMGRWPYNTLEVRLVSQCH
jgi:hypothetical protein